MDVENWFGKLLINKTGQHFKSDNNNNLELIINNNLVREPISLANGFNNFFVESVNQIAELFSSPDCTNSPLNSNSPAFIITELTDYDVANLISGLKNSNAKDAFGLSTTFLKQHKDSLVRPITHLINLSFKHAHVPAVWKVAAITPIFKSGKKTDPSNYRPISILPIVSKVAEKWVNKQLIKHLNLGDTPLHPMQFGFRANHSTETAICMFLETVKSLLDKNALVGAVFLDLKKAFDSVNHQVLLSRLTRFNFSKNTMKWFASYLSERKQYVTVDGVKSTSLQCNIGVPQGSVLGPVLFSLFINDLPNQYPNVHTIMYADDVVILREAKTISEVSNSLTCALTCVQEWLTKSCLLLNSKKTVCMMLSKRHLEITNSNVLLNGEELSLVNEFRYLGVTVYPCLSFKKHVKTLSNSTKFHLHTNQQNK